MTMKKTFYLLKKEKEWLVVIVLIVVFANLVGFRASFQRERNIQRVLDLGAIQVGLAKYKSEHGYYPLSSTDGKIIACRGDNTGFEKDEQGRVKESSFKKPKLINLIECQWGKDPLGYAMDLNYPAYLSIIPADPASNKGIDYLYFSDGGNYQIYASFENKEPTEYNPDIAKLKLRCGKAVCNFGRSSGVSLLEPIK
jgi:type II secretory pathway pseudopilin PulG